MSTWNGKRFSVYTSDEKSALGLIEELGGQTNYNTDELEKVKISDSKKVSHQEMQDTYKIDKDANFTGSWYGIEKPTASQEGLQTIVDKIVEEDIPNINSQLAQKANLNTIFTMANMGQDVKEAMTGGSVAVVGDNTILESNLVDGQVTPLKSNFFEFDNENLWLINNFTSDGIVFNYDYNTFFTSIKGTPTNGGRTLIKKVYLTSGTWSIRTFNGNGVKPSIYVYDNANYISSTWGNYISSLGKSAFATNINITEDGYYYFVAYATKTETFDYTGKIMLSKNNYNSVLEFIPITLKLKDFIKKESFEPYKNLKNKKLSILGVSIDTYKDYIPSGNSTYYSSSNLASVDMTWWKKLLNKTGMVLETNNSWSGACATTKKNLASSGVQRCTNLGVNPDFIIISAFALNDWSSSNLTYYDKDTMVIPNKDVDLTVQSNYDTYKTTIESYGGAMATIFYRIMEKYHNSKIFVSDAYNYYRDGAVPFTPNLNNPNINICNEILYDVARQFGIEVIRVSECGINAFNSLDYTVDGKTSGSIGLHPDDNGHTLYFNKVIEAFNKYI